ncbi:hypothetical protein TrVE_jg2359 [Triparma verrucosa]|uniref:Zinc/iron permease n=1 Tax=Triparma verrucosa TaxID=1606542 RepID=A0A9W6ZGN8_9STRA|nr:hypothetical protein TrVE_jg2359 [Triparma verrucosa]
MTHPPIPTCIFLTSVSIIGVLLPYFVPKIKPYLPTIRPFGTGVVLAIAVVHLLPDAVNASKKVEMPKWAGELPLAESLVVAGFLIMVLIEQSFCPVAKMEKMGSFIEIAGSVAGEECGGHCHHSSACNPPEVTRATPTEKSTLLPLSSSTSTEPKTNPSIHTHSRTTPTPEELYKMYMLELSIAVHSVLVGLPVTASSSQSLVWALGFHQIFEGMSLGLAGLTIDLDRKGFFKLATLFGTSISVGVLLGFSASGLTSGTWQAYTNSLAAGIVLFVAVEFYNKDFGHGEESNGGGKVGKITALFMGAIIMGSMAIWT